MSEPLKPLLPQDKVKVINFKLGVATSSGLTLHICLIMTLSLLRFVMVWCGFVEIWMILGYTNKIIVSGLHILSYLI